jgi:DnaK suppressor protein
MSHPIKLNRFLSQLHDMRARLDEHAEQIREESSHGIDGETSEGFSNAPLDLADRACLQTEVAVNIGLAENESHLRAEIDDALERIARGTFGICAECGAVISANRLRAVPYTRFCIRCERRIEAATE